MEPGHPYQEPPPTERLEGLVLLQALRKTACT
jgi:hypothetical protein